MCARIRWSMRNRVRFIMTRGRSMSTMVGGRSVTRGRTRTCIIISMRDRNRVVNGRVRSMCVRIDIEMGMCGCRMSLSRSIRIPRVVRMLATWATHESHFVIMNVQQ